MALQDLTPQLRTRLGRVERAVGVFIGLAVVLMLVGFGYYVYQTAKRKGWFLAKVNYVTCLNTAAGLRVGDKVRLLGRDVGEITDVELNDPYAYYNVTVYFRINKPYYGYVWNDSVVKVAASDFLGNRSLVVTKGRNGIPTVDEINRVSGGPFGRTNKVIRGVLRKEFMDILKKEGKNPVEVFARDKGPFYAPPTPSLHCWLEPDEAPAVTDRLEQLLDQAEKALPNILNLTNQLSAVLTNTARAVTNLDAAIHRVQPIASNLADITTRLRDPHGSLGEWLLPTNLHLQLQQTLTNANATLVTANSTLTTVDTNLTALVDNIGRSLDNLANLTSNLNTQVQGNTNLLSEISSAISHTDNLVQGLKRHWLLRSAFRGKTNQPPTRPLSPPAKR
ncbi:MAG: MCE family protein [Verrucomicrobia bacterium]|nr:MCE family protein [Verrucomicrobiota bacterium]